MFQRPFQGTLDAYVSAHRREGVLGPREYSSGGASTKPVQADPRLLPARSSVLALNQRREITDSVEAGSIPSRLTERKELPREMDLRRR